jgi:uncharacterized membrane protein
MATQTFGARLGVVGLILLALPIGIYALAFQPLNLGAPDLQARLDAMPLAGIAHLVGGGIALLIGGLQFVTRLRTAAPHWHRWLGRVYLILVLIGGVGGAVLATRAGGGLVGRTGFFLLAVLWLASGTAAYRAIRIGDVANHRRWMMRNYALTFAAVTLRIELGVISGALGYEFAPTYQLVAWLAWVPNLIVVEWWLLQRWPAP